MDKKWAITRKIQQFFKLRILSPCARLTDTTKIKRLFLLSLHFLISFFQEFWNWIDKTTPVFVISFSSLILLLEFLFPIKFLSVTANSKSFADKTTRILMKSPMSSRGRISYFFEKKRKLNANKLFYFVLISQLTKNERQKKIFC
jgi:hypothetical protein